MELPTKLLSFLFSYLLFSQLVSSEFRFCYKGPQRIKDNECPGGFIAKKSIPISCKYFARDEGSDPIKATFTGSFCESNRKIHLIPEGDSLSEMETFQQLVIEPGRGDSGEIISSGTFEPEDICTEECLEEWEEIPAAITPEEPQFDDGVRRPPSAEIIAQQKEQTRELFTRLMDEDEDDSEEDSSEEFTRENNVVNKIDLLYDDKGESGQSRIVRMLAQSMRVVSSKCAPYVTEDFFRPVLTAMVHLNSMSKEPYLDVSTEEYERINQVLHHCMGRTPEGFILNGTVCAKKAKINSIFFTKKNIDWPVRLQARSFRWGVYDPIVEAAWAAVDFVHGFCFNSFLPNLNYHHIYQVAMESLFPRDPVQTRWKYPTKLKKGDTFWNNILQTSDAKQTLKNLDACVIGGYSEAPYKYRLERPFISEEYSKRTEAELDRDHLGKQKSTTTWNDTMEAYWKYYDERGGIKSLARMVGACLTEDQADRREDIEEQIRAQEDCTAPPEETVGSKEFNYSYEDDGEGGKRKVKRRKGEKSDDNNYSESSEVQTRKGQGETANRRSKGKVEEDEEDEEYYDTAEYVDEQVGGIVFIDDNPQVSASDEY